MTETSAPAGTHIGHVHLKVANLDRSVRFYRDVMGFDIKARLGEQAAFLSAGGYHHHIGLNTWESAGGTPPPPGSTGLFHFAINYPTRRDLAMFTRRLDLNDLLGELRMAHDAPEVGGGPSDP